VEDKFKKLKKIAPLFPKTTAVGRAFINRDTERAEIEDRVLLQNHTWIAAIRRIGKTSLLEQACLDISTRKHAGKVVSFMTDMNLWPDAQALQRMLENAASEILNNIESRDPRKYLGLGKNMLQYDKMPTLKDLERCWAEVYQEEIYYIQRDYGQLKPNEQKVVSTLARQPEKHPLASDYTKQVGLAASSIWQAIKNLQEDDVVGVNDEDQFYVLDPGLKIYVRKIVYADFKMDEG